uniref:Uncharacterized protein n=1 Tax=Gasterosteus aculeatus aculeatus TaxID=481459 RepID=A0AAQ4R535_GASAC
SKLILAPSRRATQVKSTCEAPPLLYWIRGPPPKGGASIRGPAPKGGASIRGPAPKGGIRGPPPKGGIRGPVGPSPLLAPVLPPQAHPDASSTTRPLPLHLRRASGGPPGGLGPPAHPLGPSVKTCSLE